MQPSDEIKKYSNVVCEQIRWKKAQNIVSMEIENHILDQRDAYLADGDDEATATQKAVKQMGDAVYVGLELDKTHKPKAQWAMITLTSILMLIGIFANSIVNVYQYSLKDFSVIPFVIAFGIFMICYFGDFTLLGKYPTLFYYLLIIISVLILFMGGNINGRSFWMIGDASISLSYLSLLFPLVYALFVYAMRNKGYVGILLCGIGYLPLAVILFFVPTFVGFLLFTISALLVLFLSIARGWFGVDKRKGFVMVLIPILIVSALGVISILNNNYQFERLINRINQVKNPYSDRYESDYIYYNIREILYNAQLMGKGTIPAIFEGSIPLVGTSDTDYMLTILTHQFGWIAFISIMSVIILFSILAFRHILKQKNMLGTLVAFSILTTFVIQVLFYMFSNLGYGFFGALSLPFISYGRTSLFINAALIGFMLSVFRTGDVYRDEAKASSNQHKIVTYKDGQLIINLK